MEKVGASSTIIKKVKKLFYRRREEESHFVQRRVQRVDPTSLDPFPVRNLLNFPEVQEYNRETRIFPGFFVCG